ncbi:unnamed protein product [Lymnaea stagnalis]|uniref:Uncharacterized protein n=1 Tax=Lymnaea stagnalis TaxID=6523 RepID=A0AAV2I7J7_LYMST
MLPISDFKKDTLPKEYRHNSLVSLVQNISILTGRLNIDYVSDKRPEKYPDSDDPYPLYDKSKKGAHDSRFATGIVVGVEKNTDTDALCYCFDCRSQGSTTTKKWGKVYLLTTKTVIFDKSEALKTKFTLFFDNKTRVLSGSSVKDSDINYDWCEVECATCDTTLIDKLSDNLERCSTEMKSVNSHFIGELTRPKLAIIVFHPFKQPKTFSYGFWKDRFEGNKNTWTNYEYNVGTERGAAGAFVYIVGVSDISKRYVHVHCGLRNHGGYSSFGLERTNDASNINDNRGPRVDN